jgi:hypothetical protein
MSRLAKLIVIRRLHLHVIVIVAKECRNLSTLCRWSVNNSTCSLCVTYTSALYDHSYVTRLSRHFQQDHPTEARTYGLCQYCLLIDVNCGAQAFPTRERLAMLSPHCMSCPTFQRSHAVTWSHQYPCSKSGTIKAVFDQNVDLFSSQDV